ncbi:MAG: glycosyltransferase family 2 protein [Candidatus Acidiferrales bacterium]
MTAPLVSVLIDTYNQAQFIEQALVSVLEQGLSPSELEIVVVDDGSTDNTASLVAKFAPRIRYIRKDNGGQASAFNAAIPETHAPIVAFLDADDWWAKNKLATVLDVFERNPELGAVGHGYFEVRGVAAPAEIVVPQRACRIDLANAAAARLADCGRHFLGTSRLTVRKRVLSKVGPIPEELVFCADTPILTVALALGGAVLLDQPLCYYRLHAANLFALGSADAAQERKKFETLQFLLDFLPCRLTELGVSREAIVALLQSDRLEADRLKLIFDGGWPWETFRTESRRFRVAYQEHSNGYALFKWLVLASTLLMPPRRFYRLLRWYSEHNLQRFRKILGEPVPSPAIQAQRRKVALPQ